MARQEKDGNGYIGNKYFDPSGHHFYMTGPMQNFAGAEAKITMVSDKNSAYDIDVDDGRHSWEDWMFEPGPHEMLSAKEAILAMVEEGRVLYDESGRRFSFNNEAGYFELRDSAGEIESCSWTFGSRLSYKPPKRNRTMTGAEAKAWAESEDSLGWMARRSDEYDWNFPRLLGYTFPIGDYQRVRILPDRSGIDKDTIQGFEVEEWL
jgi:hypothetical protein